MPHTFESNCDAKEWTKFLADSLKERKEKLSLEDLARCVPIAFEMTIKGQPSREEKHALALARGVPVRQKMAAEEGGSISAEETARLLGISKQAALAQYHAGKLLGFRTEKQQSIRFPSWQFGGAERLPGLAAVLDRLAEAEVLDDWGKIGFFLQHHRGSNGKRPLDLLRKGKVEEVLRIADAFVE